MVLPRAEVQQELCRARERVSDEDVVPDAYAYANSVLTDTGSAAKASMKNQLTS